MVLAGTLALPLWLLWAFSSDGRSSGSGYSSRSYGREGRRQRALKIWGLVAVIVGLVLLWWFPSAPWIVNWIALGLGVVCVLAGFAMVCSGWRKLMGVFALGVVMMCMGFVPHPQYRYVGHYRAYDYSPFGVEVINGRAKHADGRELYGLADRYGMVLEPNYVNFYLLDRHQPFLAIDDGQGVGVYDLERHELVVPINDDCTKISVTGDKRYQMVDSAGRPFAEIELPRMYYRDNRDLRLVLKELSHETPEPEALLVPDSVNRVKARSLPRRIPAKKDTGDGADRERQDDGGSLNLNGPVGESVNHPGGESTE